MMSMLTTPAHGARSAAGRRRRRYSAAPGTPRGRPRPHGRAGSRWTATTDRTYRGVILQYVWRVQEVFTPLAYIQFTALVRWAPWCSSS